MEVTPSEPYSLRRRNGLHSFPPAHAGPTRAGFSRRDLVVVVVVLLAAGAYGVPALQRMSRESRRQQCLSNLDLIGRAMSEYTAQSGGKWPWVAKLPSLEDHKPPWHSLPEVLRPFMEGQSERFHCPADSRTLDEGSPLRAKFGEHTTYFETEGTSYEWVLQNLYAGQPVGRDPLTRVDGFGMGAADQPIVWDFGPFHAHGKESGAFNILYADFKARPERGQLRLGVGGK